MKARYHIRPGDVAPYSPANHTGTRNFRLIGPETVGARNLELLVGEVERDRVGVDARHHSVNPVGEGAAWIAVARIGLVLDDRQGRGATLVTSQFPVSQWHEIIADATVADAILDVSAPNEWVLDPFVGSGTTAVVARRLGRRFYGYDLSPEYVASARRRVAEVAGGADLQTA